MKICIITKFKNYLQYYYILILPLRIKPKQTKTKPLEPEISLLSCVLFNVFKILCVCVYVFRGVERSSSQSLQSLSDYQESRCPILILITLKEMLSHDSVSYCFNH